MIGRTTVVGAACLGLAACAGGQSSSALLQSGATTTGTVAAGSTATPGQPSVASKILAGVAVERVVGKSPYDFKLPR